MNKPPPRRQLSVSEIKCAGSSFYYKSYLNAWGEDDPIVAQLLDDTFDELETIRFWRYLSSIASDGDLFIDVGAYSGLFSLVACVSSGRLRVAAFEPSAVSYGRLVDNILLNSLDTRVCAAHMAAWSEARTVDLQHRYGIYSMCPGESVLSGANVDHVERVSSIALDNLLTPVSAEIAAFGSDSLGIAEFGSIRAIKVDVEGAELPVLEGAKKLLEKYRPIIICELLTTQALEDVRVYCQMHKYEIVPIMSERNYALLPRESRQNILNDFQNWKSRLGPGSGITATRKLILEC